MKKITSTSLLLFIVAFIFSTSAQKRVTAPADRSTSSEFRKVQFGLGLGLNSSSIAADFNDFYYFTSAPKLGVNFGTYLKIRPAKIFAFQFGIQISTKGMNADEDETLDFDIKINMSYLEVPIMFKFYAYKGLNIEFGPTLGILASSSFYIDDEEWDDFSDAYLPIDISLGLGVYWEFKFGLAAGLHYDLGLTNINNEFLDNWDWEYYYDRDDMPMKNRTLRLTVFYYF